MPQRSAATAACPGWAGMIFAIGLAFWMPMLPKPVRIIDGLLIGIAGIPLAWTMWRIARSGA